MFTKSGAIPSASILTTDTRRPSPAARSTLGHAPRSRCSTTRPAPATAAAPGSGALGSFTSATAGAGCFGSSGTVSPRSRAAVRVSSSAGSVIPAATTCATAVAQSVALRWSIAPCCTRGSRSAGTGVVADHPRHEVGVVRVVDLAHQEAQPA